MARLKYGTLSISALLALLAQSGLAAEDEDEEEWDEMAEVRLLSTPSSGASAGLGYSSSDAQPLLGRYQGRNNQGYELLLNVDHRDRDDETGTWTLVRGTHLGRSSRNVRYELNQQGVWNFFLEFDELKSRSPYNVTTNVDGLGTDQQSSGGTPRAVQLSLQRENLKVGMGRQLSKEVDIALSYRHEKKDGERHWNPTAVYTGSGIETFFMTEPVDYRTQELDAKINYTTDELQLQGGYRLSMFDNPTEVVRLDISAAGLPTTELETSTPPDNRSHLLYLDGGYRVSALTRATFKVVYQQDRQTEGFYQSNPFNNQSDLDGKVDTTRVNLGISSRLQPALTVNAKLRYDDRDNRTTQARYITTFGRFNQLDSRTTTNGTLDAIYRLDGGTRLSGGLEYDRRQRDAVDEPNMARRKTNTETTLHVGARKPLSESLDGSLRLSHSDRDGSGWLAGSGIEDGTLLTSPVQRDYVNSIQYANRQREQLRAMLDWYPTEELTLQWVMEGGYDRYSGLPLGPRQGKSALLSLDASYQISDEWSVSGWVSRTRRSHGSTSRGWSDLGTFDYTGSLQTWAGDAVDEGSAIGVGFNGLPLDELKVGGQLQWSDDSSEFDITSINAPADAQYAPVGSLSEIDYRQVRLRLFGEYALNEQHGVRVDYQYDRIKNNDWTWNNHGDYSGTTVTQVASDSNHFIGLSYYYRGW